MGTRKLKVAWQVLGAFRDGEFRVTANPLPLDVRVTEAETVAVEKTVHFTLESDEWEGDVGYLSPPVISWEACERGRVRASAGLLKDASPHA